MGDPAVYENASNEHLWEEGLRCFEIGDYFEVHELLEELWRRHDGDLSDFYQGLLMAAVSLYHYGNGNFHGAKLLAKQSEQKLRKLPPIFHGIDLARFKADFGALMAPVLAGASGLKPLDPESAPKIHAAH
ncbi:MAG: DUF309 domain-containing protein [Planctomycetes bacterium]|nr:DUF309 domain-containing protein [Planctomycetota bacterium]